MGRRKLAKGIARKIILDAEISLRLDTVLESSRQPLSGFVQDAIVQRLARWEDAAAFIDRKRRKLGKREQSAFDTRKCWPSGWPKKVPSDFWKFGEPANQLANLKQMLLAVPAEARVMLQRVWAFVGLGTYGDKEWAATLAWYKAQEQEPAPAEAPPEPLPDGWGQ